MGALNIDVDWASVLDALTRVERLNATDSGLLSFGPSPSGGVFVERGRICWVAAHGLQRRLRDLLLTRSSIGRSEFEQLYERCRAEGRFFGQTLVAEGRIEASALEAALLRHSAESLVALCRGNQAATWLAHRGPGYVPQFTFRALDVLRDLVSWVAPDLQRNAEGELSVLAGADRRGGAFFVHAPTGAIVPLASIGAEPTLESSLTLGRWANAVPLATKELGGSRAFALAATATGDTVAIWTREDLLFALVCEDRAAIAAVTARHLHA